EATALETSAAADEAGLDALGAGDGNAAELGRRAGLDADGDIERMAGMIGDDLTRRHRDERMAALAPGFGERRLGGKDRSRSGRLAGLEAEIGKSGFRRHWRRGDAAEGEGRPRRDINGDWHRLRDRV